MSATVLHVLCAHDPVQRIGRRVPAEKADAGSEFRLELVFGHVRLVPPIVGNDPAIGDRRVVDDEVDSRELVASAGPNQPTAGTHAFLRHSSPPVTFPLRGQFGVHG